MKAYALLLLCCGCSADVFSAGLPFEIRPDGSSGSDVGASHDGSDPNDASSEADPSADADPPLDGLSPADASDALAPVGYSDTFSQGVAPTPAQMNKWATYRSGLLGSTYTKVTMTGSYDSIGHTCTGSPANTICQAMASTSNAGPISCNGHTWEVYYSSSTLALELSSETGVLQCLTPGYSIRPTTTTPNWGGVNTATCNGPSQTISVICE